MNVDSILISEFASVDPIGRLTVVNAFNRLYGPGPSWGIPFFYITLVIHGHHDEGKKPHTAEIRLVDAQRESLLPKPMKAKWKFGENDPIEGMPLRHIMAVNMMGVQFQAPGPYAFEVFIDGIFHAAHTLYVAKTDARKS